MPELQRYIPEREKPDRPNKIEQLSRRALHESAAFLSTQVLDITTKGGGNAKFNFHDATVYVDSIAGKYLKTSVQKYGDGEIRRRLKIINRAGPIVRNALYNPGNFAEATETICNVVLESNIDSEKLSREMPRVKYLRYLTRDTLVLEQLLQLENKHDIFEKIIDIACSTKIPEAEKTGLIKFFFSHFTELCQKSKDGVAIFKLAEITAEYGDDKKWDEIEGIITDKELLVAHLILSKLGRANAKGYKMIMPMLGGLDKTAAVNAWLQSASENTRSHALFVAKNLKVIAEIQRLAKDSEVVKTLNKEFGIFDFARYPTQVLLAQYAQREADIPYGVLSFPRYDHGGHMYAQHDQIQSLYDQLKEKFGLRIVETHGKLDMGRKLVILDKKYGTKHKIEFIFISAHGNTNAIVAGESETQGTLATGDIKKKNRAGITQLKSIKEYFVPKPTIIIGACLTGAPEGIGQNLSRLLDGEVIAPDNTTVLENITADVADDRPKFSVLYSGANTKRYISGVEMQN